MLILNAAVLESFGSGGGGADIGPGDALVAAGGGAGGLAMGLAFCATAVTAGVETVELAGEAISACGATAALVAVGLTDDARLVCGVSLVPFAAEPAGEATSPCSAIVALAAAGPAVEDCERGSTSPAADFIVWSVEI